MRLLSLWILFFSLILNALAEESGARCKDYFSKIPQEGTLAYRALQKGVISIAVPIPIRRLPELMNGKAINHIPNGMHPIVEGLVGFYPLLAEGKDIDDRTIMLSQRTMYGEDGKIWGDHENIVLIFSIEILDKVDWDSRPHWGLKRLRPDSFFYSGGVDQRLVEIDQWARPQSHLVIASTAEIGIQDVRGIWVHPDKTRHFKDLWNKGYDNSSLVNFDFHPLLEGIKITALQPQ